MKVLIKKDCHLGQAGQIVEVDSHRLSTYIKMDFVEPSKQPIEKAVANSKTEKAVV